jgi:hypothetical protein
MSISASKVFEINYCKEHPVSTCKGFQTKGDKKPRFEFVGLAVPLPPGEKLEAMVLSRKNVRVLKRNDPAALKAIAAKLDSKINIVEEEFQRQGPRGLSIVGTNEEKKEARKVVL